MTGGKAQRPWRATRLASSVTLAESPEDGAWLTELIRHTPLLPDAASRAQWLRVLPWLDTEARYALAAALLGVERALTRQPSGAHGNP